MEDFMEHEQHYPRIARRMMPHVDETLDMFPDDITEDSLNKMSAHLVSRSGALADPPPSASDFARWLILARLAEEAGVPFFPPFWYTPFPVFPPQGGRGRPRRGRR